MFIMMDILEYVKLHMKIKSICEYTIRAAKAQIRILVSVSIMIAINRNWQELKGHSSYVFQVISIRTMFDKNVEKPQKLITICAGEICKYMVCHMLILIENSIIQSIII